MSLEQALARAEGDVDAALRAGLAVVTALKKLRAAVRTGNLRDLPKAMGTADNTVLALSQQFSNAKDGWDFDADGYLSGKSFLDEIVRAGKALDLRIFEQDGRLYCYPVLVRVLPNDKCVQIDKGREARLRPSVLAKRLKDLQSKPTRFRPQAFLDCLYFAYSVVIGKRKQTSLDSTASASLMEIYKLLTLLPGQSKDYSVQEFGRDIYLLDKSGVTRTGDGHQVRFAASTGTKEGKTIRVVTEAGQQKTYFAVAFGRHG